VRSRGYGFDALFAIGVQLVAVILRQNPGKSFQGAQRRPQIVGQGLVNKSNSLETASNWAERWAKAQANWSRSARNASMDSSVMTLS